MDLENHRETICKQIKHKTPNRSNLGNRQWTDENFIKLCKVKNCLYKQVKKYPGNEFVKREYNRVKNKVTERSRKLKELFYKEQAKVAVNNPKAKWSFINNVLYNRNGQVQSPIINLNYGGKILTQLKDVSNAFNKHFVTVGEGNLKMNSSHSVQVSVVNSNVNYGGQNVILYPTTRDEIGSVIRELKNKNNVTVSKVSNKLLKYCVEQLIDPITEICNLSFNSGTVPNLYKIAKTIPIFKSGDPEDPMNYRPISLLPAISKVLEKLVKTRLLKFLHRINFFLEISSGTDLEQAWIVRYST